MNRFDIPKLLYPNAIGIELGTAEGGYAKACVDSGKFLRFITVDEYADKRFVRYKPAVELLQGKAEIIRARFDEILDWFPDNYFDFIYIDGFAHTGEEDGQTLYDWWPKCKAGGLFCGDDYSSDWPLVKEAVDRFVKDKNVSIEILPALIKQKSQYDRQPSYIIRKP